MSGTENKALVAAFYEEMWNRGNLAAANEFVATDLVDHDPAFPGLPPGREGFVQLVSIVRKAFPDLRRRIDLQVAEGDMVVTRFTDHYTHTGPFAAIPATGKQAVMSGINIERIAGGKIVELWHVEDLLGLMQQLGVVPVPQ